MTTTTNSFYLGLTCAALFLGTCTATALAWGAGHTLQTRMIMDRLPESIHEHLTPTLEKEACQSWGHYPDSFKPFDADLMGPEAMATLKKYDLTKRYDLHSDKGRAVAFSLLVRALHEHQYKHAIFWIACLSHSTGDMCAANHATMMDIAWFDWTTLPKPDGPVMKQVRSRGDLSWLDKTSQRRALLSKAIDDHRLTNDRCTANQAMLRVMMYGYEGSRFLAAHSVPLLAAEIQSVRHSDDARAAQQSDTLLSRLGAWAAVRVLRDVDTAIRLTAADQLPTYDSSLADSYKQHVAKFIHNADITKDSLYADLFKNHAPGQGRGVGVVLEPLWRMNDAMLGYDSRYVAAAACRTLQQSGRDWVPLDLRNVLTQGIPPSNRVPVVVVVAQHLGSLSWMRVSDLDAHLKQYIAAGGKVIWLSGYNQPPASVRALLPGKLERTKDGKWPVPIETLLAMKLDLVPAKRTWPLTHSPQTPAGWQRPYSPFFFTALDPESDAALLTLDGADKKGGKTLTVGVISPKAAFIPLYAIHPYIWGQVQLELDDDPARPTLDPVGRAVLLTTIDRLTKQ